MWTADFDHTMFGRDANADQLDILLHTRVWSTDARSRLETTAMTTFIHGEVTYLQIIDE